MSRELTMYDNPLLEGQIEDYLMSKVPDYNDRSWKEKKVLHEKLIRSCKSCNLCYETAFKAVPPIINRGCFAVFIGRNPSKTEAIHNEMFPEGTSQGNVFRKYLSILGLGQSEVSVLNVAYCTTKGNRPPEQEKINRCIAYKKFELALMGDSFKIIFAMGNDALKWLFGLNSPGVMQSIGDLYTIHYRGRDIVVVPIIHPSHLLMEPELNVDVGKILKKSAELIKDLKRL